MDGDLTEVHGLKTFDCGEEELVRERAHLLCREYLNGAWRKVSVEDFVIKKVGGGLSNLLYYCALPKGVRPLADEPNRALLRLYGPTHEGENVLEAHFSECVVFTMLSEKQNGPRLYGIFPGGRLEQYIPGRPLATIELLDEDLSPLIAESIAQIHSMSVPLSKEPNYIWSTLFRWVTQIETYMNGVVVSNENMQMVKTLKDLDLRQEVHWLKNFLKTVKSPVVFCHNDLQEGNILVTQSDVGKPSIVIIDFEYCAYNYRAYDLANNMCETIYDYSNEEFPYFWSKPENFPSREQQARFVEKYLCKLHSQESVPLEEIDRVLEEIEAFILASHLYWAIWSIVTASSSTITFDYWGYGAERLAAYFDHKATLLKAEEFSTERCLADVGLSQKTLSASSLIETSS